MSRVRALIVRAALAGAATALAGAALEADPPGGHRRWSRTNFAGRQVTLLGGAALGAGTVAGSLLGALVPGTERRTAAAGAVAAGAAGAMGLLDDLTEDPADRRKGLRGHLGALAQGRITTGTAKIAGIGAGALAAAALLARPGTPRARAVDIVTSAALVAGTANLHNLFDLRPGRTLKVATALSVPLALAGPAGASAAAAAVAAGAAATAAPGDLAEHGMLGDTGANAVGALVGVALAAHPSPLLRGTALAGVVALTLASERVSFSRVIESSPTLARLDGLGRRG